MASTSATDASECQDDFGELHPNTRAWQIGALVGIFVASCIGFAIPFCLRGPRYKVGLFLFRAFSAGIMLATGVVHVFPEGMRMLGSPCLGLPQFLWAPFITSMAALLSFMLEFYLKEAMLIRANSKATAGCLACTGDDDPESAIELPQSHLPSPDSNSHTNINSNSNSRIQYGKSAALSSAADSSCQVLPLTGRVAEEQSGPSDARMGADGSSLVRHSSADASDPEAAGMTRRALESSDARLATDASAPAAACVNVNVHSMGVGEGEGKCCGGGSASAEKAESVLAWRAAALTLEVGTVVHSLFMGMALGTALDVEPAMSLGLALIFHQGFEGISLGSALVMAETKFVKILIYGLIFALITPVGIVLGIGVAHFYNPSSPVALGIEGTLNSVAAGILLFASLVNLVAPTFDMSDPATPKHRGVIFLGFVSMIMGTGIMSLIGKWA